MRALEAIHRQYTCHPMYPIVLAIAFTGGVIIIGKIDTHKRPNVELNSDVYILLLLTPTMLETAVLDA